MLIAALIATFFLISGDSMEALALPDDFTKNFEIAVTDESRKDEIQEIIDEAAKHMIIINDSIQTIVQNGRQLNLNYSSTEEDFKTIIAGLMTKRKNVQGTIMNLHFRLRDKITEEQWQIMFGKKTENNSE